MIHTYTCYAPMSMDKNIGATYNKFMGMVNDDDWVCFLDHDAMFTTHAWYKQLEQVVERIEEAKLPIGLLTAVTNRIGNVEQIIFNKISAEAQNHDMYFHRKIGRERMIEFGISGREATNLISGIVMLTSKKAWKETGGFKDGFLGVDNDYDLQVRKAGYKTVILDGLYVYHWYRADGQPMQGWQYPVETNLPLIK